jgi:hypothetical protein
MAVTISGTNGIAVPLGSASAPSESNTSSATTGAYYPTNTTYGISTAGTNAVYITSGQNVGIGTTTPSVKLSVISAANTPSLILTDNTQSTLTIKHEATNLLTYETGGSATQRFVLNSAEAMRIDSSGNLLVGYTSSNGAYKLQVNSQIFATSATIATSDGRYKENITSLDGALNLVQQLNPVQFSWKQHPVHNFDREQPTIGFIAQEVQEVLKDKPYLNSVVKKNTCTIEEEKRDKDGNITFSAVTEDFYGIAEGNMVALLTKAIQELSAKVEALKSKVGA